MPIAYMADAQARRLEAAIAARVPAWKAAVFDMGCEVGIAAHFLAPDGAPKRHAVRMPIPGETEPDVDAIVSAARTRFAEWCAGNGAVPAS